LKGLGERGWPDPPPFEMRDMARGKYATVKIPAELASKLDDSCEHWGYRSRAAMVDEAIRLFIGRMNQMETRSGEKKASNSRSAPGA